MQKEKTTQVSDSVISDSVIVSGESEAKNIRIKTKEHKVIYFGSGFISGIAASLVASILWEFISKLWN